MTFNIRYDTPKDSMNSWEHRKDFAASYLPFYDLDICGMQETLVQQCQYLDSVLEDYSYIGVGRDDGKEKGEFSPIFYNHTRLKPLESGTFWLSESPAVPGKAWDANLPRIVTWAKFKWKGRARSFYVFNTHFDHQGVIARRESATLLLTKVKEIAGDKNAIITGDFNTSHMPIDLKNAKANEKTSGFMPEEREWVQKFLDNGFVDIFRHLYPEKVQYTWWTYRLNARARGIGWRLDYFLISEALVPRVRDVVIHENVLGSDHCPVELILE